MLLTKTTIRQQDVIDVLGVPHAQTYVDGGITGRGSTIFMSTRCLITYAGIGDTTGSVLVPVPCACSTPPIFADPPLPPVWPYPVGAVYQREHWSMDVQMIRIDTKVIDFVAYNGDGTVMDLTGATIRFTAKWDYFDADADAVIKLDNAILTGITVTAPATAGVGVVTIPKTATSSLPKHRSDLVYDIKVKKADTTEHTTARGRFVVLPNSTETI